MTIKKKRLFLEDFFDASGDFTKTCTCEGRLAATLEMFLLLEGRFHKGYSCEFV